MSEHASIDPGTTIGAVRLNVADLEETRAFYEDAIGLRETNWRPPSGAGPAPEGNSPVALGTGGIPLVELISEPEAPPRPSRTTGLFHLAILVPTRADLARAIHRIAAAGERLTGASDHLVSEALYLDDPEGNGIEIYRDRPREDWPVHDGQIQMDTLPLDLNGVLGELSGEEDVGLMPERTRMGHVHLNVGDLAAAEAFYAGVLGFDVTVRGYPGALFVSAGGYHHHIGLNTWAGEGAPPPPQGSRGLRRFEIHAPNPGWLDELEQRLAAAGVEHRRDEHGLHARDPAGNGILVGSG